MNPAKMLLKQAAEKKNNQPSAPLVESKVATGGVKEEPTTQRPVAPPAQPKPTYTAPKKDKGKPTELQQIARPDVPIEHYGVKGVQLHFQPYNKELRKWLKDFSAENQSNGGCAITKTQAMEIMLDVMMYDLEINPIGYDTQQQMREDIIERMRNYR